MLNIYSTLKKGLSQVVFPRVCVCCGLEITGKQRQICSYCLDKRFEDANPDNHLTTGDTLLPEGIIFQHALWLFDKGGDLQHLLYQLKYELLVTVGMDLGRKLGFRLRRHPVVSTVLRQEEVVLLPVPLHYLKFRKRGFNQAFIIARGVQQVWPHVPVIPINAVIRSKNTRTQTGLTLQKRLKNLRNAFRVRQPHQIKNKTVVIVDDVFTTGATTYELARTLRSSGCRGTGIITLAQA